MPTLGVLAEFFDITKSSKQLFEKTNISGSEYISQMNQYPVIFLSFANAKGNLTAIVKAIKEEVKDAYKKYQFVLEDINFFDQPYYQVILNGLGNPEDGDIANIDNAVSFLMKKLEYIIIKR
ncbi:AAA family ATPase [Erysipelotrichaceae bacterium 66202529]|nr:AAA family ATPase [[Clostridium] innocuum]QSI24589.1 AAA family ATPase [Erysipelotrichaceae bacterium 66202529]